MLSFKDKIILITRGRYVPGSENIAKIGKFFSRAYPVWNLCARFWYCANDDCGWTKLVTGKSRKNSEEGPGRSYTHWSRDFVAYTGKGYFKEYIDFRITNIRYYYNGITFRIEVDMYTTELKLTY